MKGPNGLDIIINSRYNKRSCFSVFFILVWCEMSHDAELLQRITEVVNASIRPALNADGGDISIVSLDGNVLSVKLQGACSHCPRASITLQSAVQATLRKMVSENIEVRAV